MTAITFDTLKFVRRLREAGVPEQQAEAEASALAEVFETQQDQLVTKSYLNQELTLLRTELRGEMAQLRSEFHSEIHLIKWILALVVVVNVVPALKTLLA